MSRLYKQNIAKFKKRAFVWVCVERVQRIWQSCDLEQAKNKSQYWCSPDIIMQILRALVGEGTATRKLT